jgi:hypothetical protein
VLVAGSIVSAVIIGGTTLSKTHHTKRRPITLVSGALTLTLALAGCSSNSAAPPATAVATTTTTTATTPTTTTSTTSTSTTALDPKTLAAAAARDSWETFRANIYACQAVYPNCDVDILLVPYLTNPNKDLLVSSYARLQADAKVSGAVIVDIELSSDVFENIEFTNSEFTEAILTSCGIYGAREIIPATPTTPEIVIDDERNVSRIKTLMVLEPDGVWRVKDTPSPPIEFEGVETCPPEN